MSHPSQNTATSSTVNDEPFHDYIVIEAGNQTYYDGPYRFGQSNARLVVLRDWFGPDMPHYLAPRVKPSWIPVRGHEDALDLHFGGSSEYCRWRLLQDVVGDFSIRTGDWIEEARKVVVELFEIAQAPVYRSEQWPEKISFIRDMIQKRVSLMSNQRREMKFIASSL